MEFPNTQASPGPLLRGVIRSVKPDRGFGYVIPSDPKIRGDLYFYHKWCRNVHLQLLQPGIVVEFRVRPSVRNVGHLEAYDVSLPVDLAGQLQQKSTVDGTASIIEEAWKSTSPWKAESTDLKAADLDSILSLFPPVSRVPFASVTNWGTNASKSEGRNFLRVNGVVRMRDEEKGFGHISVSAQSGMNTDLFFHYTWCTATPFAELLPGTHVECSFRASHRKQGHYEAFDIIAIAAKATNLPPVNVSLMDSVEWIPGRIKMIDRIRGFGHIICDDEAVPSDVFFHHTACVAGTIFGNLTVGSPVEFTTRPSARKIGSFEAPLVRTISDEQEESLSIIDQQLSHFSLV